MTLLLRLPEVPATVTVNVPIAAVPVEVKLKALVLVAGFVPKAALTPLGNPDATNFTSPSNPFRAFTVIVLEPPSPWAKVKLVGDAERVKLGCGAEPDQLLTKFAALTLPMPVAKSQPVVAPYAGAKELSEVESTPTEAPST